MEKYRYLIKNVGLLTLSNFATKFISFFLVPLYTKVLTTSEFGSFDLLNTTIGVLLPILTINIQESVLRFSIDKKYTNEAVLSVAMKYIFRSNFLVILGLFINKIFCFSVLIDKYCLYFFLMFFIQSLSGVLTFYIRGIDRVADLSISSVFASIITILCNILFLLVFDFGIQGYFLANIFGPLFQCIYIFVKCNLYTEIKINRRYDSEEKNMLSYSRPLIMNSIAWWVNNASDRYLVIFFCGLSENGIYSVASKIPSILNVFQSIFNQAWTLSAVKDFDPKDEEGFFSKMYNMYNCFLVIICSFIIAADKPLAKLLYSNEFYLAWQYVPWLTISILFGALSGYIGGFFSAIKNSSIFSYSSIAGAITNILLNLILIPMFGVIGAAISTMICYIVVWGIRLVHSRRIIKLKIKLFRDSICYLILLIQSYSLFIFEKGVLIFFCQGILIFALILFYIKDIMVLFNNSILKKK